jgi:hypothetical protein
MDGPKQAYGYFAIDVFLKDIRRVARIFTECLMSGPKPGPNSGARTGEGKMRGFFIALRMKTSALVGVTRIPRLRTNRDVGHPA